MAVNVSELFAEYDESDFQRLCAQATDLVRSASSCDAAAARPALQDAEKCLVEADQAIKQMELEVRALPPEARMKLQEKMKSFRQAVRSARQLKEAQQRQALLGDATVLGKADVAATGDVAHQAMMEGKLTEAKRTILDSEQIGLDVMSDLRLQRETIERSRENMGKVGQNYSMAGKTLDGMLARADQNRRMVCFIGTLMLFMMAVAFYFIAG